MAIQPRMTRRHFEFIADVVANIPDEDTRDYVAHEFVRRLVATNANFDRERFLKASKVNT